VLRSIIVPPLPVSFISLTELHHLSGPFVWQDVELSYKSTPMPIKLTNQILDAAILGFEEQKRQIDSTISELRAMLSGGLVRRPPRLKPHHASAGDECRWPSRIARRSAKDGQRPEGGSAVSPQETAKPKRKLSAEGRRAISEATRRRWALKRAQAAKAKER